MAGWTTLYHHSETPFLNSMRDRDHERRLDPARWEVSEIGPLPQDCANCSVEPRPLLPPDVSLSSGRGAKGTRHEIVSQIS